ncbi:signal transduction histidine kinase [Pedobacter africanus]|uniref:Signal transduction histidine kinase n=1 Tax=Pedobacter africanus TaxID=151894 RepID=A0ACC6L4A2_9SPHI|nr:signal transduction histidine kinase [Pedobacter africanus]
MLKKYWFWLVGDPMSISLEGRIFHTISVIAIPTVCIQVVFNLFIHLYQAAVVAAVVATIQLFLYYLSRFKNKLNLAIILSAIEINISNSFAYIYNSGIEGSILLLFAVSLFLTILISARRQWLFLFILNAATVISLLYVEFMRPGMILQHYSSRQEMFIDIGVTYFIVICLLYICTTLVRKSYDRQKNEAVEKAHKLELINIEKDKLFSLISHDLTTPLASVKQYMQLLTAVELDIQDRSAMEQKLISSVDDAQYLLNNLLLWARNQLQNNEVQLEQLNFKDTLNHTLNMFLQMAKNKNIRVLVNIPENLMVKGDKLMIQSVARNLLNNAFKFTPANGDIEVKARQDGNRCIFSVKDSGVGISAEKQRQIFTLRIASSYGTENEKGTGLGLSLCKDFIEKQGGKIWFESVPKAGTTFYIALQSSHH